MMEPETNKQVAAVVVVYRPDVPALLSNLAAIAPQVGAARVIDNSQTSSREWHSLATRLDAVSVLASPDNLGLGAAYNRGIQWAKAQGFRFVILFDQDSAPADDMVAQLYRIRAHADESVVAVGPVHVDARTGQPAPFVRFGFPLNHKIHAQGDAPVDCDFLISSGCLIDLQRLDDTDGFDETLFIDNVDMEWCMRMRARGRRLLGVPTATMQHEIGARLQRLPWPMGETAVHPPFRLYYIMRNRVLLYFRRATPKVWIAQDLPRLVFKLMRFGLFVAPRGRNLAAMLRGIRHGLAGKAGPLERSDRA